jgi:hypothetical protein
MGRVLPCAGWGVAVPVLLPNRDTKRDGVFEWNSDAGRHRIADCFAHTDRFSHGVAVIVLLPGRNAFADRIAHSTTVFNRISGCDIVPDRVTHGVNVFVGVSGWNVNADFFTHGPVGVQIPSRYCIAYCFTHGTAIIICNADRN